MKIDDAIKAADELQKNSINPDLKLKWLAAIDGQIYTEQFLTHKDSDGIALQPSTSTWNDYVQDLTTLGESQTKPSTLEKLFAGFPYDEMYIHYLLMKYYLSVQEISRANNELAQFNEIYAQFSNYINRKYLPISNTTIKAGANYYV